MNRREGPRGWRFLDPQRVGGDRIGLRGSVLGSFWLKYEPNDARDYFALEGDRLDCCCRVGVYTVRIQ